MKDVYIHEYYGIICHYFNKIRINITIVAEKPIESSVIRKLYYFRLFNTINVGRLAFFKTHHHHKS